MVIQNSEKENDKELFLKLINTAEDMMKHATESAGAEDIFSHKEITPTGNSGHIIVPQKYAKGKHEAMVIISKKNKEEDKKR